MRVLFLLAALFTPVLSPVVAQAPHTADAPQILEGPQIPGQPPPLPPVDTRAALMNNDAVLRMSRAGLGEQLIVQTINTQSGAYDLGPDQLIALKQAGLSEPILNAMIARNRKQITPIKEVVLSDVNEVGVYYKDRSGRWTEIDPEIVRVVSGGFIKSTLTHGIIKEDRNGSVDGRESKLLLPRPIEFLIYTPDAVTPAEYDFVRFRLNSKSREFRTLTGGVIHSKGGAQRDEQEWKPVKTGPHTWTFTVDSTMPGGEYGILPPGTGNVTNGGRIYTFAISE